MPSPGKRWYHIILNTHGSWLPGDPRGFRTRKHKRHSRGDYKRPPPKGEHTGLHQYARANSGKPVTLNPSLRPLIGRTILDKINQQIYSVLAICIGSNHAHILCELPDNRATVKRIAGTWKQAASHKVRKDLPGTVWAAGGDPIPIEDKAHQRRVYTYILRHRDEGAWTWSFRDE